MIDVPAFFGATDLLFGAWQPWLVVPPGLLIGLVFGAVPGLSVPVAMAVFLPLTVYMDFLPAMLFLTAIFTGGSFGGAGRARGEKQPHCGRDAAVPCQFHDCVAPFMGRPRAGERSAHGQPPFSDQGAKKG